MHSVHKICMDCVVSARGVIFVESFCWPNHSIFNVNGNQLNTAICNLNINPICFFFGFFVCCCCCSFCESVNRNAYFYFTILHFNAISYSCCIFLQLAHQKPVELKNKTMQINGWIRAISSPNRNAFPILYHLIQNVWLNCALNDKWGKCGTLLSHRLWNMFCPFFPVALTLSIPSSICRQQ